MDISVLGIMSGSSLDGLDLALVNFHYSQSNTSVDIVKSQTIPYQGSIETELSNSSILGSEELLSLDVRYSKWISVAILEFLRNCKIKPRLIGVHGHTVFHRPDLGFSTQLGNGNTIYSETGIACVTDFRNEDISNGGQGAPLAPKGDIELFPEYDAYLNLGGIANITIKTDEKVLGYDICPFNLALNEIASLKQLKYDEGGKLAESGKIISELLLKLNSLSFFKDSGPKSIDKEWYKRSYSPIINQFTLNHSVEDILKTLIDHQSTVISKTINSVNKAGQKLMISGGGAHNTYFIEELGKKVKAEIFIPEKEIVDFKEAIIFAFLALLRVHDEPNAIASVTGAKKNSVGGALYGNVNLND